MDKPLIIIGYSGHAFTVVDIAITQDVQIVGYVDKSVKELNPFNLKYLGTEEEVLESGTFHDMDLFVAIGENVIRKRIMEKYQSVYDFAILQHITAIQNLQSSIGEGSMIASGAILNTLAEVGYGTIINTGAIVEHECIVGDFSHIAPGAVLAGNVTVGDLSFIGANAVVKQGVKIGNNVTIGAGSVVLQDVPDNETWVGNPARIIKAQK